MFNRPMRPYRAVKTVCSVKSQDRSEAIAVHMSYLDPITMRQARIGISLREVYDEVTDSPLPSTLEMLLAELDGISLPAKPN